jgi:hypothetical protein
MRNSDKLVILKDFIHPKYPPGLIIYATKPCAPDGPEVGGIMGSVLQGF